MLVYAIFYEDGIENPSSELIGVFDPDMVLHGIREDMEKHENSICPRKRSSYHPVPIQMNSAKTYYEF